MNPPSSTLAIPQRSHAAAANGSSATSRILLLSQLYPPDVGGSAVLLHEGYVRVPDAELTVVADAAAHSTSDTGGSRIVGLPIATTRWGLLDPRGLSHHFRLAWQVRRLATRDTVIHCARALPEGIAAAFARQFGGPRYVVWTHGEDLTSSLTSRDQTMTTRWVHRGAAAIVANSQNTRRLLRENGVPDDKVHVIYPGVDPQRFSPAVDGRALRERLVGSAGPVLLSVGRLQRRKGHDLALGAVARLVSQWPGLRYVIVGTGKERPRLEGLVRSYGIEQHVVFAGESSVAELPQYYAACDLFLLPNRDDDGDIEGFGIVFLEAAASERPVVAGNTGGVPEAVADGETGLLVSGTDEAELVHVIGRILRQPDLGRRLARSGRERVLRGFTWGATAGRIKAVHDAAGRFVSPGA